MTRLLPFLFLAGIVAELASIILAGSYLGLLLTLVLLFAGAVAGISLIRSAGAGIVQTLRSPGQAATLQSGAAGKAMAGVVSGLLFLIPGFFSDFLGVLLLVPSVRQWLRARIPIERTHSRGPTSRRSKTVIDGEAIEIDGELQPPQPPSDQGRRVTSGE
jgi:UPF0716 protein FxsA